MNFVSMGAESSSSITTHDDDLSEASTPMLRAAAPSLVGRNSNVTGMPLASRMGAAGGIEDALSTRMTSAGCGGSATVP